MQILNLSKLTKCILQVIPFCYFISLTPYLLLPLSLPLITSGVPLMHGITRNSHFCWVVKTPMVITSISSSSFPNLAWLHQQVLVLAWIPMLERLSIGMGLVLLVTSAMGFASTRSHFPYRQTWSRRRSRPFLLRNRPFLLLFKNGPILLVFLKPVTNLKRKQTQRILGDAQH